ncbi:MAG: hypothetical protein WBV39_06460 [Rudaea sp.]
MPGATSTPQTGDPHTPTDFATVVGSALDVAAAWMTLVEAELTLAARSLRTLLLTLLIAPVVLVGFWTSLLFLLMTALHAGGCNWPTCAGVASATQLIALLWLARAVRRLARDLTFSKSRALIVRSTGEKPQ